MRTYNKAQDYKNRLKFAILLISLLGLWFFASSCNDDEDPDLIPGKWEYSNDDFTVNFELAKDGGTYSVSNITVNGSDGWKEFEVSDVNAGKSIGYLGVKSNDDSEGIAFINTRFSGQGELTSDTVAYVTVDNVDFYFNQVLKKN